jgi:hypothetical protein
VSARALAVVDPPEVIPAPESGCYFVASASVVGGYRKVDARTKTCSCPAGRRAKPGGKPCRHLTAVYEFEGRRQAEREGLTPPTCCRGVGCRACGYTGTVEGYEHRRSFQARMYGWNA